MSKRSTLKRILLVGVLCYGLWIPAAHAYLDPATGSIILQSALAAIFGSLFFFRQTWGRLAAKLRRRPPELEQEASNSDG